MYVSRYKLMIGYSDRINHALAFAAKHHDRQVRKGTRLPYLTQPANVAIILTRYGCDEDTIVAAILQDVIEDCVRDGWTRETFDERIGEKFGVGTLDTVLAIARRKTDDGGNELDESQWRADRLRRLAVAPPAAQWVAAAAAVHSGNTLLADLRRTVDADAVWGRFRIGRESVVAGYRELHDVLRRTGSRIPILDELAALAGALGQYGRDGRGQDRAG